MTTIGQSPQPLPPLQRLIERIIVDPPSGLIAVIGMSPPRWPPGAVFVFDDAASIVDAVAGLGRDVPFDLDLLFVRRSELAMLGYQPAELMAPTHVDLCARQGPVLWGVDLRSEIPAIGDARTRLAINVERAAQAVRRPILFCLTLNRDPMLIQLLGREIAELRQSVELVAAAGADPTPDVNAAFEAWRDAEGGQSGIRASWRFERVLLRLRHWLHGGRSGRSGDRRPSHEGEFVHRDALQPRDAVEARYGAHIAAVLEDLTPARDRIVSVLLSGSVVRHTLRPGISDIMDGVVIVDDEAFESKVAHAKVMSAFVRACRRLASSGLPFHPFQYYSRTEVTQAANPFYDAVWRSPARSIVLAGEDIQTAIQPSPAGHVWGQRALFAMALRYRRLAALGRADVEPARRESLLQSVRGGIKTAPLLACLSCGQSVDPHDAPATLTRILDGIDLSSYDAILPIDKRATPPEEVPALARSAVDLLETIASRTAQWVHRHRDASFWRV